MSDEKKHQPMTEEQRAEIRRRWSGVSLGEWSHGFDLSLRCNAITCDGKYLFLVVHPDLFKNESALEFLAHARQDMRALLDEVERLRAENQRLEQAANWLADILEEYTDCCPLRFALENCETSRIPKVDGCEGTWPVGDYFHCLVRRENKKCWVEAAVKATSGEVNHE